MAETCESCIGTGIGWNGPDSHCWECNGRGVILPKRYPADEDLWAFNHFAPDPGEDDLSIPEDHQ